MNPTFTIADHRFMRRALALARRALGRTAPNPPVGCVLVRAGRVVGEGYHHRAGLAHAEVEAITDAGAKAVGATAYVTLEPCNHVGRTGPCAQALLDARVARVVVAVADPNRGVAGGGAARLREAGVTVELGLCEAEACELAGGFFSRATRGRPRVTLKAAVSLDGRIAASSGDSKWITGEAARRDTHRLRDASDAILVGAGTVRADDPALTTRLPRGRDARAIVLDGALSIPLSAKLVRLGTLVATRRDADAAKAARLRERGVEILRLPEASGGRGGVDLGALLVALAARDVLDLLVEGGAEVHGAFLAAGLVDRVVVYVAPKLIGAAGVPLFALPGAARMGEAWTLGEVAVKRLGDDVRVSGVIARPR